MEGMHRVALVTGAAHGIGMGIAAWLVAEGWQVVLADIDTHRGEKVATALGPQAWFMALDVTDEGRVTRVVGELMSRFGRLDALVNNAAQSRAESAPLEHLPLAQWQHTLAVNLTGPMLMSKRCAPHLRASGGSIINVGSTRIHQSEANCESYAASKGGLLALTHAMAVSLGPDVRVNMVSPGWIDSRDPSEQRRHPLRASDHAQHPAGRVGSVEDVAAMIGWLLSAQAGFVTGQEFVVDGGMSRQMVWLD